MQYLHNKPIEPQLIEIIVRKLLTALWTKEKKISSEKHCSTNTNCELTGGDNLEITPIHLKNALQDFIKWKWDMPIHFAGRDSSARLLSSHISEQLCPPNFEISGSIWHGSG